MIGYLRILPRPIQFVVVGTLVALVGISDYVTGCEIAFSIFYSIPNQVVNVEDTYEAFENQRSWC